jgi:hypothetical protein
MILDHLTCQGNKGERTAVIDDDARRRGRSHGAIRRHDQGAGIDRG